MLAIPIISFLFATLVKGYANPLPCTGVCVNAHDPALIRRDDGTYFRFSTGGKVAIHSAPSITGPWAYKGAAIHNGSIINKAGRNDLWVSSKTMKHFQREEKQKLSKRTGPGRRKSRLHILSLLLRLHFRRARLCHRRRN